MALTSSAMPAKLSAIAMARGPVCSFRQFSEASVCEARRRDSQGNASDDPPPVVFDRGAHAPEVFVKFSHVFRDPMLLDLGNLFLERFKTSHGLGGPALELNATEHL